jgi:Na+-transporting NADH:ubiquinone oxidoreductase subunit A
VVVKEEQMVKAGEALFIDKNHPEVKFVSPVSGKVTQVERGARRKVLSIRVEAAGNEVVDFGKKSVASLNGAQVKEALLEAGLFAFFKQRPYDVVPNPEVTPRAIFVSAFDSQPLAPEFEYVLAGQEADFQAGLEALAKMAPTYLGVSAKQTSAALKEAKGVTVTVFDGPHPAGNVGVQINHTAPVNKGEVVWTLGAEEVIFIGRLFNTGKVDFTRTIAVAGSEVKTPAYARVKVGVQIASVLKGRLTEGKSLRIINGNVLTGYKTSLEGFVGAHATELTVIPEGDDVHEMLGWIMPRFDQFSTSRSYFSWLLGKKEYTIDARVKGGERHMIMSGEYDRVFPMDIMPEYLIKAIIAGDIDRMEALGIYEVAPEDFALCEFVDSSKLELQRIVREGLDALRKEME